MPVKTESLVNAIKQMREASPKRKFEQSVDLSITLKGIDPKKQEGRFAEDVVLSQWTGEPRKILVFADGELARRARDAGADLVMSRRDIEELQDQRKRVKKLAADYDFSIAQADFMVMIGKVLGPVLGPRGKMPKPIPPTADPRALIERLKRTVRVATKDQAALHANIGVESMSDEQLAANAGAIIEAVERRLGEKGGKVDAVIIKTTMGKPVRVEVQK
ncbi:MAG: 50S ribosomal protein L1 [Hadesarchaea archaeon]|nr:50S ribosomal protein L1 [Hadesarchaea archaeon]